MVSREIEVPEGVEIEISGYKVKVKGPKGEIEKEFKIWKKNVEIKKENSKVKVVGKDERRKTKAMVGTVLAHIRNMIKGVTQGYTYRLRIVYSHFPISIKIENGKVIIQNFLGERTPRIAEIVGNVKVEVKGSDVVVSGIDKDEVSQTAANIEQACRIVGKDRRRFIDGIYIYSKEVGM